MCWPVPGFRFAELLALGVADEWLVRAPVFPGRAVRLVTVTRLDDLPAGASMSARDDGPTGDDVLVLTDVLTLADVPEGDVVTGDVVTLDDVAALATGV